MLQKQYISPSENTNNLSQDILQSLKNVGYFHKNVGFVSESELLKLINDLSGLLHNPDNPIIRVKYSQDSNLRALSQADLEIHNECVYMKNPPEYVLLYCVKGAESGGDFYMLNSQKIIKNLSTAALNILRNENFVFSSQNSSVERRLLLKNPNNPESEVLFISNIGLGEQGRNKVMFPKNPSDVINKVIQEVQLLLSDIPRYAEFHNWQEGDLIIFDNYQVLHGRESFVGTDRELVHIRFNIEK